MNQAVAQHLSFGDQLVFSLGPWASIYTQSYHPATDRMMLIGGLYLAASCWLAFLVLIDRRSWAWVALLAAALLPLRLSRDAALFLLPLMAMLASLRITASWCTDHRPVTGTTLCAVAVFFAPVGIMPLIKGSALILSAGVAACGAAWYLADRKPALAATAIVAAGRDRRRGVLAGRRPERSRAAPVSGSNACSLLRPTPMRCRWTAGSPTSHSLAPAPWRWSSPLS